MAGPVAKYVKSSTQKAVADRSAVALLKEKVAAAQISGSITIYPPLDGTTEETEEHRRAYPIMLRSPVVKAALLQKVFSVASLDLQVMPAGSNARDKEIADFVRYAYLVAFGHADNDGSKDIAPTNGELVKMAETILLPGLIHRSAVCEKVWPHEPWKRGRFAGKVFLRDLKAKPDVEIEYDEFRNIVGVRPKMWVPVKKGEASPIFSPRDFVIFRNLPMFEGPGMSDFRAAYGYWQRLDAVCNVWMVHLDKFTSPHLLGKYAPGDTGAQKSLEGELQKAKARHYTIVPDDVAVEVLQMATRGESEFEAACRYYEEKIALAICGAYLQFLTAQGGSGDMRGDSQTQKSVAELFVWHLAALFTSILNKQVTPDLVDLNYIDADYPLIKLGGINWAELKQGMDIDKLAQDMGFPLSKAAFAQKYALQEATDPNDILTKPEPAAGGLSFFAGPPANPPAQGSKVEAVAEVAAAAADVKSIEELLNTTKAEGVRLLATISTTATARLVEKGKGHSATFFNDEEWKLLRDQFVKTNGTAELLGRARVRLREERAKVLQGAGKFSAEPTALHVFRSDPISPLGPKEAIDYFTRLVPSLTVDVVRFGRRLEREAFTLAARTDKVTLSKVKTVIETMLKTGDVVNSPRVISQILRTAGVAITNPQYPEMVFRTNMMDAYNVGVSREIEEAADTFPVWMYANPDDGRSRPHHAGKHGRYYSAKRSFIEVRGPDISDAANCRCTPIPIDRWQWKELQARGARIAA